MKNLELIEILITIKDNFDLNLQQQRAINEACNKLSKNSKEN